METKFKNVREERTGWRDKKLDILLEENGLPQTNSFLVTEYNHGKSIAMIEYKKVGAGIEPDERIIKYCNARKNKEYYFIILYDYEFVENKCHITRFIIYPKNDVAIKKYGKDPMKVNELRFIDFLYEIRENTSSKYREKAHQEYSEWFELNVTFDIDKQVISKRHRSYAYDVPAADVDSIVCDEENNPYLFVEYKENNNFGKSKNDGHNDFIYNNISQENLALSDEKSKVLNNKAIADLGDGCKTPIPVLAVEYSLEHNIFSIYAFNKCAKEHALLKTMTQEEYFKYIKDPNNFKKDKVPKEGKKIRTCPKCGNKIEVRSGIYGKFYGCVGFKINKCRYTEEYIEIK
ncbi:topoisomerase DNA-binding C4 zinc finger domain-containing protein [Lacrimispora amygdalina]|uniref:topoisomerase DNA-binding C4 zinc finger domain-containing protein n=1 Tax=Lacrimispora amygdalina TaxID=253257 RepID=UPI000BE2DC6F|nr:topoisomerase DNA-binding C4 zinc finger domain-containing protein [Lacrimispora amygdalina]